MDDALKKALGAMSERKDYMKRCAAGLGVEDTRTLARDLRALSGFAPKARAPGPMTRRVALPII